jgi:hypothetical protein
MPRISEFYGIVIYMYSSEHGPPHFHSRYAGVDMPVEIATGKVIEGALPGRIQRLVRKWAYAHRDELYDNWTRARNKEALKQIAPMR